MLGVGICLCWPWGRAFDQLNRLRYCGIKVNRSKEKRTKSIFASTIIDQCMADIRYNHCMKLVKLTFFVPFTKNGIFKLTKCGLSPKGFCILRSSIKTRIEWLKRIIVAVIRECIFGDATTFINKDWRVSFGDIFIVQPGVGKFGRN